MKKYIKYESSDSNVEQIDSKSKLTDNIDFYERWYAKFGKPQPHTLSKDAFMKRLKEMKEFE